MTKVELYSKIDKFCNETDWKKYPTYENALEEFINGIVAEETKELRDELNYAETHCLFHSDCPTQKENAELRKVAEFQQSSNMNRYFENKKLKEGLAVGSTFNKALNSINKNLEEERDKYRNMVFDKDEQLTNAKEIIENLIGLLPDEVLCHDYYKRVYVDPAEQFLKEIK
jgi:hypothetical protein